MKEKEEHIDGYFKDRLENFKDTPGPEVWDNIAKKIESVYTKILN